MRIILLLFQAVYSIDYSFKYHVNDTKIDISKRSIASLNTDIGKCTELKVMNASGNILTDLPDGLENCQSIQTLNIEKNRLTENVLKTIGKLKNLKSLRLGDNQIGSLSSDLEQCRELETLCLNGNQLKQLPSSIGENDKLTTLDLKGNKLETLPPELEKCIGLRGLGLDENSLKAGAFTIISKLKDLRILYLSNNQLEEIPSSIGENSNLMALDLRGNKLKTLPEELGNCGELERLRLNGNSLSAGAFEIIGKLTNLKELHLRKCNVTLELL